MTEIYRWIKFAMSRPVQQEMSIMEFNGGRVCVFPSVCFENRLTLAVMNGFGSHYSSSVSVASGADADIVDSFAVNDYSDTPLPTASEISMIKMIRGGEENSMMLHGIFHRYMHNGNGCITIVEISEYIQKKIHFVEFSIIPSRIINDICTLFETFQALILHGTVIVGRGQTGLMR